MPHKAKEKKKEWDRKYRATNKDAIALKEKARYAADPEKFKNNRKKAQSEWYLRNKDLTLMRTKISRHKKAVEAYSFIEKLLGKKENEDDNERHRNR